jgi:hypothetical protein
MRKSYLLVYHPNQQIEKVEYTGIDSVKQFVGDSMAFVQIGGQYFAIANKDLNADLTKRTEEVSLTVNFEQHIKGQCIVAKFNGQYIEGLTNKEVRHFAG